MQTPSKSDLRLAALRARKAIARRELVVLSEAVCKNVVSSPEYTRSEVIATYVAKTDEVSTEGIIRHSLGTGKRVLVPVSHPEDMSLVFSELRDFDGELSPGHFGVPEPVNEHINPVPLREADLVLVPMVAWDERGYRLGYGKGYFDSALAKAGVKLVTMGLGLESQFIRRIPEEKHDVPLSAVATEKRIVRFVEMR